MNVLFQKAKLYSVFENLLNIIKADIKSVKIKKLENKKLKSIVDYYSKKYAIKPPSLLYHKASKSKPEETTISNRVYGREYNTPAFLLTVSIPITGDSELLNYMPSQSTDTFPEGELNKNDLTLFFKWHQDVKYELKAEYADKIELLEKYVGWISEDVNNFIPKMNEMITSTISKRLEGISKAKSVADELDLPTR